MTPRTPQCEVFWPLLLNSKHSGVLEDPKSPTLGMGVSSSHFTQSGVATEFVTKCDKIFFLNGESLLPKKMMLPK